MLSVPFHVWSRRPISNPLMYGLKYLIGNLHQLLLGNFLVVRGIINKFPVFTDTVPELIAYTVYMSITRRMKRFFL